MEAIYDYLNSLINNNKIEFANQSGINWLNPYNVQVYQEQRDKLVKGLPGRAMYNETKPYYQRISKGCEICGAGTWSCLFITNKCNAKCFYCPTPQTKDEVPATQGMEFKDAGDYAAYINYFGYKGVSFSGGEPFIYFKRTLDYLKAVRKYCNSNIYTWVYTNGILTNTENLKILADNGLNEIRFDIGAIGFNLENVKKAKKIIPVITIEIPAVPEEMERLMSLLPDMANIGVNFLNLHQLRMTSHNANQLIKRGYTVIPAERPLILESELTALEILNFAGQQNIQLGINYCSFHFKNRFQKAGYRKTIAGKIFPMESITENGYIRHFDEKYLRYETIRLSNEHSANDDSPSVILLNGQSYRYTIAKVFSEEIPFQCLADIKKLLAHEIKEIPTDPFLFKIWQFEYIETGLREY